MGKSLFIFVWGILIFGSFPSAAFAAGNGVCNGRPLPPDRSRQWSNHYLACTKSADHYIRRQQAWDMKRWLDLENLYDQTGEKALAFKMQKIGQELPKIEWKGTIFYATYEHWNWVEWVYGQDISCGTTTHYSTTTDSKGRTTTTSYTTINSCWHNETRSESRHCSDEAMPYDARFVRPTLAEWSPDNPGENPEYYSVLPNKYDLLPGEMESVNVYNSGLGLGGILSGDVTSMTPYTEIADAWNKYEIQTTLSGGRAGAACVYGGGGYHADVTINTVKRELKTSPNAFREPVDEFGETIEPIPNWTEDSNGTKVRPHDLWLSDSSATLIAALSRSSRNPAAEKQRLTEDGVPGTESSGAEREKERETSTGNLGSFWKRTQVRLRVFMKPFGELPIRWVPNYYTNDANETFDSDSEHYKMVLTDIWKMSSPWRDRWLPKIPTDLIPGEKYEFRISMYQKGVPFYAQDCDDPKYKKHWNCRLGLRGEGSWFSKELTIPFRISPQATDQRSFGQKVMNSMGKSSLRGIGRFFRD